MKECDPLSLLKLPAERSLRFGYAATGSDFLETQDAEVIGYLSKHAADSGFAIHQNKQTDAWVEEIQVLKSSLARLTTKGLCPSEWTIVFEYDIPRRNRRIDVILISARLIFIIEFKTGQGDDVGRARNQVVDYALELADFHSKSEKVKLVPIVVANSAPSIVGSNFPELMCSETGTLTCPESELSSVLYRVEKWAEETGLIGTDGSTWLSGIYHPTPTIVEAAQILYARHDVNDIARSEAGSKNLKETQEGIAQAIQEAREDSVKVICFVTGVPGAGKTLAGLNAASQFWSDDSDNHEIKASFFSGNGPLVKVLVEALARSSYQAGIDTKSTCERRARTFVQGIKGFLEEYIDKDSNGVPYEQVVVFDEAQRAWDAKKSKRKHNRLLSEPMALLQVMDRHKDWAAVVCLIGNGQEIHDGEAGLREWGRAIEESFSHWRVVMAGELAQANSNTVGQCLFDDNAEPPAELSVKIDERFHLEVPVRSYRSTLVADWIEAVLMGNPNSAQKIMKNMDRFPIMGTRSLGVAKEWLRTKRGGLRRCGLVTSSGAKRLRPFGVDINSRVEVVPWFLNDMSDVRSSFALEQAAREFDIQGLELDWIGMCWGADLRWCQKTGWIMMDFKGTKWQHVSDTRKRQYLINKYRVLLSRAREGVVIWVSEGNSEDKTCPPEYYNETASYLKSCGVRFIS